MSRPGLAVLRKPPCCLATAGAAGRVLAGAACWAVITMETWLGEGHWQWLRAGGGGGTGICVETPSLPRGPWRKWEAGVWHCWPVQHLKHPPKFLPLPSPNTLYLSPQQMFHFFSCSDTILFSS